MKIQFHGGAQTVTGSQYLVTVNDAKILLECGLYQGRRKEAYQRNLNFGYDPADVDIMLLSHAHIDHSGNIPNLYKNGFRNSIYSTSATADLCQIMLRDSAAVVPVSPLGTRVSSTSTWSASRVSPSATAISDDIGVLSVIG